jgi:hypothetical protein
MAKQFSYSLDKNASKVHKEIVGFFKDSLPGWKITQNSPIKIDNKTLYADILCKAPHKFLIEIQGEQHKKFVKHFHGSYDNFKKAQLNDKIKKDWAEMNEYCYIEVNVKGFKVGDFYQFLMGKLGEFYG